METYGLNWNSGLIRILLQEKVMLFEVGKPTSLDNNMSLNLKQILREIEILAGVFILPTHPGFLRVRLKCNI